MGKHFRILFWVLSSFDHSLILVLLLSSGPGTPAHLGASCLSCFPHPAKSSHLFKIHLLKEGWQPEGLLPWVDATGWDH